MSNFVIVVPDDFPTETAEIEKLVNEAYRQWAYLFTLRAKLYEQKYLAEGGKLASPAEPPESPYGAGPLTQEANHGEA